ncbi:MAG: hypothetical protein VX463_18540, partial [Pseudomonadota bacterium]|nr:hypothetical protein [Pseudomonadota bacterium]
AELAALRSEFASVTDVALRLSLKVNELETRLAAQQEASRRDLGILTERIAALCAGQDPETCADAFARARAGREAAEARVAQLEARLAALEPRVETLETAPPPVAQPVEPPAAPRSPDTSPDRGSPTGAESISPPPAPQQPPEPYVLMRSDQLPTLMPRSRIRAEGLDRAIPPAEECAVAGAWFIENAEDRYKTVFFVNDNADIRMCLSVRGKWSVTSARSDDTAHVVIAAGKAAR